MTKRADQLDEATLLLEELESIEAKLRTLQEGLTRSHRLATLGTMASVIAHEFNNILTPMISYCQIALADPSDTAMMRKAVEKSLRGAERAAEVSQSMLGFARPSERREQGTCEVAKVVTEVFSCLVRPPEKDGLSVDVQVDEAIVAAISPTALQQVLLNITLNATRAMGRHRGRLGISAESADGWVTIRVSDTGHGIDKSLQDK
ncbi:MAG: ATP-binding protein, partial [Phycisphaeraceae bacterium]